MTGRTDEKTGGQCRVAAPGAGTASPADLGDVEALTGGQATRTGVGRRVISTFALSSIIYGLVSNIGHKNSTAKDA
jgi:hypothetical protein